MATEEGENWAQQVTQTLNNQVAGYQENDLQNYQVNTLRNLLAKWPTLTVDEPELKATVQQQIAEVVALVPPVPDVKHRGYGEFQSKMSALKTVLREKFNLVTKGFYIAIWLPLGIALGLPWGVAFKNIALGIPLGLMIGGVVGAVLELRAQKENRLL